MGTVTATDERRGVTNDRAWKIRTVRVLVGGVDVNEVQLDDDSPDARRGDTVDWAVNVEAGRAGYGPRVRVTGNWRDIVMDEQDVIPHQAA